MTLLLTGENRWSCPNCTTTQVSYTPDVVWHDCRGLKGMYAPLVIDGTDCKVETEERQDYIGPEKGLRFNGEERPIMATVVTRADGSGDRVVYAPAARVGFDA